MEHTFIAYSDLINAINPEVNIGYRIYLKSQIQSDKADDYRLVGKVKDLFKGENKLKKELESDIAEHISYFFVEKSSLNENDDIYIEKEAIINIPF